MSIDKEVRLGEILIQKGWITPVQLEKALARQKKGGHFLGSILLEESLINDEQLARALSEQSKLPFLSLKNSYIDWALVTHFSPSLILDHKCFPIERTPYEMTFALTNILDGWALTQIEQEARGYRVRLVLITQSDMQELINRYRQHVSIQIRRKLDTPTEQ